MNVERAVKYYKNWYPKLFILSNSNTKKSHGVFLRIAAKYIPLERLTNNWNRLQRSCDLYSSDVRSLLKSSHATLPVQSTQRTRCTLQVNVHRRRTNIWSKRRKNWSCWIEISLYYIRFNIETIRSMIPY